MNIGIYGARGRMGQELSQAVISNKNASLTALFEYQGHKEIGNSYFDLTLGSDIKQFLSDCDAVIDFTSPNATLSLLEENKAFKKPVVIGTTGLTSEEEEKLSSSSDFFPIIFSANYSIGVNLLFNVLDTVGKVLSKEKDYDLEVVELHHRYKKDSPSGTAIKLAEVAAKASGRDFFKDKVCGREGIVGERSSDEVGVFAVRGGDIVGEHTVYFTTLGERVEITHKAHSRQTFAKGAVEAALWLKNKEKGLFSMKDVLGL